MDPKSPGYMALSQTFLPFLKYCLTLGQPKQDILLSAFLIKAHITPKTMAYHFIPKDKWESISFSEYEQLMIDECCEMYSQFPKFQLKLKDACEHPWAFLENDFPHEM